MLKEKVFFEFSEICPEFVGEIVWNLQKYLILKGLAQTHVAFLQHDVESDGGGGRGYCAQKKLSVVQCLHA